MHSEENKQKKMLEKNEYIKQYSMQEEDIEKVAHKLNSLIKDDKKADVMPLEKPVLVRQ